LYGDEELIEWFDSKYSTQEIVTTKIIKGSPSFVVKVGNKVTSKHSDPVTIKNYIYGFMK